MILENLEEEFQRIPSQVHQDMITKMMRLPTQVPTLELER